MKEVIKYLVAKPEDADHKLDLNDIVQEIKGIKATRKDICQATKAEFGEDTLNVGKVHHDRSPYGHFE